MDKVAMVSGASRGIGREIALELARRGYRLSLGLRDTQAYDGVPDAFLHPYEARDPEAARAWVDATIARFGRINVLVSNAGICRMIDFDTGTDAHLNETFEINVNAPFRLVQAALPHLRRAGAGRFVQLASLSGKRVKNLNVAVREWEDQVVFLHRIVEGGTDRSYGIHVARLAGVPKGVLERARQLLSELAVQHVGHNRSAKNRRKDEEAQLPLFTDPAQDLIKALAVVNVDELTPVQAFDLLRLWKEKFGG